MLTATDQKPQKIIKKVTLLSITLTFRQTVSVTRPARPWFSLTRHTWLPISVQQWLQVTVKPLSAVEISSKKKNVAGDLYSRFHLATRLTIGCGRAQQWQSISARVKCAGFVLRMHVLAALPLAVSFNNWTSYTESEIETNFCNCIRITLTDTEAVAKWRKK